MQILSRDTLALGGFAGIREHRLVTDSRVFGHRKKPETFEGIGNMVYLADARYLPEGESGMHPHSEIDVISVIVEGRVSHEGSMEHGKDLVTGDIQVQRAGGEGFDHNEINPDQAENRMLQVWVLPETKGEPASYKFYRPVGNDVTRIYGGDHQQNDTFASRTQIDVVDLSAEQVLDLSQASLVYVISGQADVVQAASVPVASDPMGRGQADNVQGNGAQEDSENYQAQEGDLIRIESGQIKASKAAHLLVVSEHA